MAAQYRPGADADTIGALVGGRAAAIGLLGQVLRVHGWLPGRRIVARGRWHSDDDCQPILLPALPQSHVDESGELGRADRDAALDERDADSVDRADVAAGPVPELGLEYSQPGDTGGRKVARSLSHKTIVFGKPPCYSAVSFCVSRCRCTPRG